MTNTVMPQNNIVFFAPGSKHYDNGTYINNPNSFVNISLTGTECQCRCAHCNGKMLNNMNSAATSEDLIALISKLTAKGCRGVLLSGGACQDGSVPLKAFGAAIKQITDMGLKVAVHPGLLTEETADILAQANISCTALDLIGDETTIKDVYHLDKKTEHYRESLRAARAAGLKVAPHIVVGLHFGQIRGEYEALKMIAEHGADSLVFVVLKPLSGTDMADVCPPAIEEVSELFQTAREWLGNIPMSLGCARPVGEYARQVERAALDAGFSAIAYPARETVEEAVKRGLNISYKEYCCGMLD